MTVAVSALPVPSQKKVTKAKKVPAAHPPYGDMIKKAIKELKERGGSSRQAIVKYVKSHYKVDDRAESHLRRALVAGVKSGRLVHTKGIGASGSFKLAEKAVHSQVKPAVKPVKSVKPKTPKKKPTPKKSKPATKPKAAATAIKAPSKAKVAKPKVVKPKKVNTPKKQKVLKPKKPVAKKTPKKSVKK